MKNLTIKYLVATLILILESCSIINSYKKGRNVNVPDGKPRNEYAVIYLGQWVKISSIDGAFQQKFSDLNHVIYQVLPGEYTFHLDYTKPRVTENLSPFDRIGSLKIKVKPNSSIAICAKDLASKWEPYAVLDLPPNIEETAKIHPCDEIR
ncbi:MAG: hypothetical protein ACO1NV_10035 [Leptospira bouyouniensis]|uniref:Uncharacterized protein n=1 Tax=Leptospira bouyouniensis TaxID=2484911 RepID=A0A7I0HWH5_9LEPT|nr:hypothetical protein [Leptospira bouyouniensis]TGK52973.1 hypothetical protein EHQ10_04315 [Leptospira bouyouniensis]TGL08392.1 hypothetical protein EHQ43_04925 [Leptospira bouyouniensis]TGM87189.1 hypothetical protein EHQ99_01475 [Leptospira bouyouniensis]